MIIPAFCIILFYNNVTTDDTVEYMQTGCSVLMWRFSGQNLDLNKLFKISVELDSLRIRR